ncbi:hypothetical protein ACP4OV_028850 [Aristida adscensionis]
MLPGGNGVSGGVKRRFYLGREKNILMMYPVYGLDKPSLRSSWPHRPLTTRLRPPSSRSWPCLAWARSLIVPAIVVALWLRLDLAETLEDWELDPSYRLPYKELYNTTGSKARELLGAGGFDQVYRACSDPALWRRRGRPSSGSRAVGHVGDARVRRRGLELGAHAAPEPGGASCSDGAIAARTYCSSMSSCPRAASTRTCSAAPASMSPRPGAARQGPQARRVGAGVPARMRAAGAAPRRKVTATYVLLGAARGSATSALRASPSTACL